MPDSEHATAAMRSLDVLSTEAQECFGANLISITVYGTAAEDRLRPTSDVNLIFVFARWDESAIRRFAPKLQFARALARTFRWKRARMKSRVGVFHMFWRHFRGKA